MKNGKTISVRPLWHCGNSINSIALSAYISRLLTRREHLAQQIQAET